MGHHCPWLIIAMAWPIIPRFLAYVLPALLADLVLEVVVAVVEEEAHEVAPRLHRDGVAVPPAAGEVAQGGAIVEAVPGKITMLGSPLVLPRSAVHCRPEMASAKSY